MLARFASLPQIVAMIEQEERRAVGLTVEGIPVELVVTAPERYGTALLRATGAPDFVAALEPLPDAPDEAGVFAALGLPWWPPELREEPPAGEPPALVEEREIRGDLHCHTTWSDGRASVLEMGSAARDRGYDYVAICDHTPAVGAVHGLTPDEVRRQAEEIAAANEQLAPFRILRGIECDILPDGRLDLPDDVLAELDWVQASVHGGQRMPRDEMTRRVERAIRNPHVSCLSHPTGRMIGRRPENALDLDHIYGVALEEGVALEVNGLTPRLDLSGEHVRRALRAGVQIVCSTDAHSTLGLANMTYSVQTARRGWATSADVVNTRPLQSILDWRRARRTRHRSPTYQESHSPWRRSPLMTVSRDVGRGCSHGGGLCGGVRKLRDGTRAPSDPSRALAAYGQLPLTFVENRGQTDKRVRFLAQGAGQRRLSHARPDRADAAEALGQGRRADAALRRRQPGARAAGERRAPARSTTSATTARWRTNVPGYAGVVYRDLWPGIDMS